MYCSMNYNATILKSIGKLNPATYKKGLYTMNKWGLPLVGLTSKIN